MNCRRYEELIAFYVEGDLSAPEAANLEAHMADCASCNLFAEEMALLKKVQHIQYMSNRVELLSAHIANKGYPRTKEAWQTF